MSLNESLREQAALYALDALPADEAAKFRELARRDPELAALVAEYEAASALIGESLPLRTPPPHLRVRILGAISPRSASVRPATLLVPWGIAAALAVTAAFLWNQNLRLEDRQAALAQTAALVPTLESRLAVAAREKTSLVNAAAESAAKIADLERRNALAEMQVATLTSKLDASYLAAIVWDNDAQEGILKVRRLPATQPGKAYQLWVVDPKQPVPVSGGVFTVEADGSATIRFAPTQKVTSATAFAISLEKAGGVPVREGPVVLSNL